MANFSVSNIEIPFDMLTSEQREAIYMVMSGDGFVNPQAENIAKAKSIVSDEHSKIMSLDIHPFEQTHISEQQIIELDYWLTTITYWLDALKLHTDKLSGVESEYTSDLIQRLSIAGLYTRVMKSITGLDKEQYSEIFSSLSVLGDNIIGNIKHLTFCESSSNYCEANTNSSGLNGLAGVVQKFPVTIPSILSCLLPNIVDKLKSLIDTDEKNFCKARRVIERYSYGTKIIETLDSDPIFGSAMESVFASPQLKQAINEIRNPSSDTTTNDFFPQFNLEVTGPCLIEDQLISIGPEGPVGAPGAKGLTGSAGIPGPVGDCNCGQTNNQGEESPCWQGDTEPGACCVCGYCVSATDFQCSHYGGVFFGENSSCAIIDCMPSGCVTGNDCAIGMICCSGQCINPCSDGTCPPCPQCPTGTTVCGNTCCEEGKVCCGGYCKDPCPDGGCPDCQGECCPSGTSCCGGDGCCLDGNCCNDECCGAGMSGKTCQDGSCVCCPDGETCFEVSVGENVCCEPEKQCNGVCCGDGLRCCIDECVPEDEQCTCPAGTVPCELEGPFHCCLPEESCCLDSGGSIYCCGGECCGDTCCDGTCVAGSCCPASCEVCTEFWQNDGNENTHCICYSATEDVYYDYFSGVETTYCARDTQYYDGSCNCKCNSNNLEPCGNDNDNQDCWSIGGCCCDEGESCEMAYNGIVHYCCPTGTTDFCEGECCGADEICCPDDDGNKYCTVCNCNEAECITDQGEVECCEEGICCNGECKDETLGECCCATNPNSDTVTCVWSETGCCPHNDYDAWLEWNDWQPITRAFSVVNEDCVGGVCSDNHGCPCGCEHSDDTDFAIYDDRLPIGESACRTYCPLFLPLSAETHKSVDYRCEEWSGTEGDPCECRVDPNMPVRYALLSDTGDWGQYEDGLNLREEGPCSWCCKDSDNCEECGFGKVWCDQETPDALRPGAAKPDGDNDGQLVEFEDKCKPVPRENISCVDRYVGLDTGSFDGYYQCHHGCRFGCIGSGFESCASRPMLDGSECYEDVCNTCTMGATRSLGVCWLESGCNEEITQESCAVLGGMWEDSCDDYIPPSHFAPTPETKQSSTVVFTANNRKYSALLKKYPNKSLQNLVDANKTYKPIYENGILKKYEVELEFRNGTTGIDSSISTSKPLVGSSSPTILSQPIQFQLVNFAASKKKKTDTRDTSTAQGSLSLISKAEMKSDSKLGYAGYEDFDAITTIIQGELTASIQKDGLIGEGLVVSFVSGSNIKLDTNEANNIIRISVDDLYLHELVDVSENAPEDQDILQYNSAAEKWIPTQPGVGPVGPTGPVGGSDKQILFNQSGTPTGSDDLKYDYDTGTLEVSSGVNLNSGFTSGGSVYLQDNTVNNVNLKDYAETYYDNGQTPSSVTFDFENGNVQKVKVGGMDSGNTIIWALTNAPTSGTVGTMTVIFEDGLAHGDVEFTSSIQWPGGTAPTLSASGIDIISFTTMDGGTSYYGFVGGLGFTG
jgi:hypothetical protein